MFLEEDANHQSINQSIYGMIEEIARNIFCQLGMNPDAASCHSVIQDREMSIDLKNYLLNNDFYYILNLKIIFLNKKHGFH